MSIETIYFEHGELLLPTQALLECHHQGACDEDCKHWASKIDWSDQTMGATSIARELADTGGWEEEELKDTAKNYQRILWIAAGNYQEQLEEESLHRARGLPMASYNARGRWENPN